MRIPLMLLILLLLTSTAKAQNHFYLPEPTPLQADSMKLVLDTQPVDTISLLFYRDLGFYYLEYKKDSSIYYFEKQIALAKSLKQKLWEADGFGFLTYAYTKSGKYIEALNSSLQGLKIVEDSECEKNIWKISEFSNANNPHKARLLVLAQVRIQSGHMYRATQKIEQEIFNYSECIRLAKEINDPTFSHFGYHMLGGSYLSLSKLDSALAFEIKAIEYSDKSGFRKYRGQIFEFMGSIYSRQGRIDSAKKYFHQGIQTNLEQNNIPFLANIYVLLADLYTSINKPDSSIFYSQKGLEIYRNVGELPGMLNAYLSLAEAYKIDNNIDSAFLYQGLALDAKDNLNDVRKVSQFQNIGFDEQLKLKELEKKNIETENRVRTNALLAGIGVVLLIAFLLFRNSRNRRKTNELLQIQNDKIERQKIKVEEALLNLKSTQSQLIHSEKMASLGELTAGIAHEIQNPLNFVNNFSDVSSELADEIKEEADAGNLDDVMVIATDIKENLEKINHHGQRASDIVKGMLDHSRVGDGKKELTDINKLADEYLRLAYHGLRAKDKSFNADFEANLDESLPKMKVVAQDIGRVLLNLINNAFHAVIGVEKPKVTVFTRQLQDRIEITVSDNGLGIKDEIKEKIFQPFFTTKAAGEGTGLGLSLSYDIITKGHGGKLEIGKDLEIGSEFIITLPS